MLKQHHSLDDPKTGVPSELYKSNWDAIFGKKEKDSLWRKRQVEAEEHKHDVKSQVGDW